MSPAGFQSCKKFRVSAEGGKYPAAMLVKELIPGALAGHQWTYHDSPVMAVSEEEALRYDDTLPPMGAVPSTQPGGVLYSEPLLCRVNFDAVGVEEIEYEQRNCGGGRADTAADRPAAGSMGTLRPGDALVSVRQRDHWRSKPMCPRLSGKFHTWSLRGVRTDFLRRSWALTAKSWRCFSWPRRSAGKGWARSSFSMV